MRLMFACVLTCLATALAAAATDEVILGNVRALLVEIGYPEAGTVPLAIRRRDSSMSVKVTVGEAFPDGWWGGYEEPVLYVSKHSGAVNGRFYTVDTPGEELPRPDVILNGLGRGGKDPDDRRRAALALVLVHRWLDVHRNDELYGMGYVYDRYVSICRNAGKAKDETLLLLAQELEKVTGPRARYLVQDEMAMILRDLGDLADAEELWRTMSADMAVAGDHAWFTTRISLPLLAVARMYEGKDEDKSMAAYADYMETDRAVDGGSHKILLGYAMKLIARDRRDEAAALCERYLAVQATKRWASKENQERAMADVRLMLEKAREEETEYMAP